MSHPDPSFDPENVRENDSPFSPRKSSKSKALKKKMKFPSKSSKLIDDLKERKNESPLAKLKRLTK